MKWLSRFHFPDSLKKTQHVLFFMFLFILVYSNKDSTKIQKKNTLNLFITVDSKTISKHTYKKGFL